VVHEALAETKDGSSRVVCLTMTPVGTPLREYVDLKGPAEKMALGLLLWRQLHETLVKAHEMDIHHGDVRPSNIIIVEKDDAALMPADPCAAAGGGADTGPQVVLVDWGLGEDAETLQGDTSRRNRDMHGELAFLSNKKLSVLRNGKATWKPEPSHDLEALALTALAVMFHSGRRTPWAIS